jgi:hypothetical protein
VSQNQKYGYAQQEVRMESAFRRIKLPGDMFGCNPRLLRVAAVLVASTIRNYEMRPARERG